MTLPLRPKSHTKATVASTTALLFFQHLGWVANEIPGGSDYGEDLETIVYIGDMRTHLYFRCQVKAAGSDSEYVKRLKSGDYSVKLKTSTLQAWVECHYPVIVIVYDESTGTLHWSDAVQQVRTRMALHTQKTCNVTVPASQTLDEAAILEFIQKYYATLIRIREPVLSCEIIITFMPSCRSITTNTLQKIVSAEISRTDILLWAERQDVDHMPTWTTAMFAGILQGVPVLKISAADKQLDELIRSVHDILSTHLPSSPPGSWISCTWSPVKLHSRATPRHEEAWTKELTYWFSESFLHEKWIKDKQYSFEHPPGFDPQLAAQATGWNGFHLVDSKSDIAIQMFSAVFTHAADKIGAQVRSQELEQLFLPWQYPSNVSMVFRDQLHELSSELFFPLMFTTIPELCSEETVVGYIASATFAPQLRIFGPGDDPTFPAFLRKIAETKSLPGAPGPDSVREAVVEYFPESNVPRHWHVSQKEYTPPLPLHHGERLLYAFRLFHAEDATTRLATPEEITMAGDVLAMHFVEELEFGIDDTDEEIHICYVRWRPDLERASHADFSVRRDVVLRFMDSVLPPQPSSRMRMTRELLSWVGVHFDRRGYS